MMMLLLAPGPEQREELEKRDIRLENMHVDNDEKKNNNNKSM